MSERKTTRQTLDQAVALLEGAAKHADGMNNYMREALALFQRDPPDSDFQRGYMEALKVFANEAMGFRWDDPLLWGTTPRQPLSLVRRERSDAST